MKKMKAIKLADKSEFCWLTVNEYSSDDLPSDKDYEKRSFLLDRRTGMKLK